MDPSEDRAEGNLTDLELRLRQWQPTSLGLDRDRMLYEAGRAAARAELWGRVPLGAIAALATIAVGLGVMFVHERGERHALEVRIVRQSTVPELPTPLIEPVPAPLVERPPAADSYLVLTRNMLSAGPEILSSPVSSATPVAPSSDSEPPLRVRGSGSLINF